MILSNPIIPSLEVPDKISVQTENGSRHSSPRFSPPTNYFQLRTWRANYRLSPMRCEREEVDQRPHRSSNDKWPAITPISWSPRGSYASESGAQKINYHQPARCCNCRFSSVACTWATQPRGVPRSPLVLGGRNLSPCGGHATINTFERRGSLPPWWIARARSETDFDRLRMREKIK